ncbi:hypothetical protein O9993_09380 [Vibrio lentus]|nr:hypothetical protein [Vibrio lentus]
MLVLTTAINGAEGRLPGCLPKSYHRFRSRRQPAPPMTEAYKNADGVSARSTMYDNAKNNHQQA